MNEEFFDRTVARIVNDWMWNGLPKSKAEFKRSLRGLDSAFPGYNQEVLLRELYELILSVFVSSMNYDLEELKKVYKDRLTFNIRTSNSVKLGQFSTPLPIAYILTKWIYGDSELPRNAKVIDPFAGTGNMLSFFASYLDIYANEIDHLRFTLLDTLRYYKTTKFDGSKIEEYEKRDYIRNFDIVITNPPFYGDNSPEQWDKFIITEYDKKLVLLSLELMKDNGKAAIIFDGTPGTLHKHTFWNNLGQYKNGNERSFWFYLYKYYNVVDVLYINGKKMYSKLGQATNVRIILIDGRKNNTKVIFPPLYNSDYDKLTNSFDKLYERTKKTYLKNLVRMETLHLKLDNEVVDVLEGHYNPQSKGKSLNIDVPDTMDFALHKVMKNIAEKVGDIDEYVRRKLKYKSKQDLYKALSAEQIDAVALAIYNIETENLGLIIADQTGVGKGRVAAAIMRYARNIGKKPIFLTIRSNLFTDIYRDLHAIGCDDLIPIAEPERDEAGNIIVKYKEVIDEETGEVRLIEKPARYYKIKNPNFIGAKRFVPFIVNSGVEIKDSKGNIIYESKGKRDLQDIERFNLEGYDCILSTYSQFNTEKGKLGNISRQEWLMEMAKNNIVIMDESHQAGGEGKTGLFFRHLVPNTMSTIYLSATYAKFPKNMPIYYSKTTLRYTGLSDESFVAQVIEGGTVLQEVISENLVASGSLIRRERPLGDIRFNFIYLDETGKKFYNVPDKENEHKIFFDKITGILRKIVKLQSLYINPYIDALNEAYAFKYEVGRKKRMLGFKASPIFSKLFQVINQLIFSMKAESIGEIAIRRLKEGYKPVIVFQNTMESLIKEAITETGERIIEQNITFLLKKLLKSSLVVIQDKINEEGDTYKDTVTIHIDDLGDGKRLYNEILDEIDTIEDSVNISPIDKIKHIITNAGYKVGEMTGRSIELLPLKNGKAKVNLRKKESLTDIARKFQNNEIDVVLLNESGSTGISLHATTEGTDLTEEEVKPRVMIVAQAPLDVNTFVQMLGRINRSGQIYKPEYDIISLSIPAEKRFMAMLHEKLASLSANTTADQRSGSEMIKSVNFINKYGDEIVIQWLKENPHLDELMDYPLVRKKRFCWDSYECPTRKDVIEMIKAGEPLPDKGCCYEENFENVARRVSGRVAILSIKDQEDFYDTVTEQYEAMKEEKMKLGDWDLEIEELDLDAKILETKVVSKGIKKNSPFGDDVILEKLDVKILKKPLNKSEIGKIISTNLGLKEKLFSSQWWKELEEKSKEAQEKLSSWYQEYINEKYNKEVAEITKHITEEINKIELRPSLEKLKKESKEKYEIEKERLIKKLEIERSNRIERVKQKILATGNRIYKLFNTFRIGMGYLIETGRKIEGEAQITSEVVKAVFLGFNIKDNYPIPSNITIKFALANDLRTLEIKPTDSYKSLIDSLLAVNSDRYDKETLINWDEITNNYKANRDTIYALTGNTLLAKSIASGKWAKIKYHDGTIKKVVLLNKNAKIEDVLTQYVPIIDIYPLLKQYTTFSTDTEKGDITIQNGIRITKIDDDTFKIELPTSNKDASKFYKSETLYSLTVEGEFIKKTKKDRWQATVKYQNMKKFLMLLSSEYGVKIKLTPLQIEQLANSIDNNIRPNPQNLIYQEAKYFYQDIKDKQKKTA